MSKIGVVGSRSAVLCFMAAGFSVYEAETTESAAAALKKAADDGCAVIFVTSELAEELSDEIRRYSNSVTPAVTVLPKAGDSTGVKMLSEAVTRAVGSDIIFHGKTE
jgi:V/A-type H+-transporting ATPase subunit F